jgi:serine/threonine protein phosphatase 1
MKKELIVDNRYYCFPDIHGCSDALKKALDFVYKENPEGGKIIFLGDYIDRGTDNYGVLQTVMNPPERWEFVTLLGNHELMFIEAYMHGTEFYDKKAAQDIAGFSQDDFVMHNHIRQGIDRSIMEWMYNLKVCHIEDQNVFAHAFYDDTKNLEDQLTRDAVWTRMDDFMRFPNDKQKLYLTHGHTPRRHAPVKSPNRVNLDAGAVFYGRYVIGEYYKDIQGPTAFHEFSFEGHLDW